MKNYYLFIGFVLLLLAGCDKSDLETYKSGNYIQFSKSVEDSTRVSFLFYPGVDEIDIPISIEISAFAPKTDQNFTLTIDTERTTAVEGTHFIMPDKKVFRADHIMDTCWLKLKRTPDMETNEYRIVLRLEGNDAFEIGQLEHQFAIFRVNDKISKPDWWDNNITWYYLGTYTDKKFSKFIEATGVADMSGMSNGEKRVQCLKFKYWLEEKKQAGETVREDDMTEMTVPILG